MQISEGTSVSAEAMQQSMVSLASESWRLGRLFESMLLKLDPSEQNRYKNQFRWFLKKSRDALEQSGLRLVNIEGDIFDCGMAATPLNIEEFEDGDTLVVEQMLEPIIMGKDGLVKMGTVILRRV